MRVTYYYFYHQRLAYEYASKGACLALTALRKNRLEEVAEIAREVGSPNVVTVHADVSKPDDCRRIVDETISHFGRCNSVKPFLRDQNRPFYSYYFEQKNNILI